MEYQRFIPEGWNESSFNITEEQLTNAITTGEILQGKVSKCDSNYNLYVDFGNKVTGIIPRDQIEAVNIDEAGFPKPNICVNKLNKIVQFKVKNMDNTRDIAILSRKAVGTEALEWVKKELKEGDKVYRNSKKY